MGSNASRGGRVLVIQPDPMSSALLSEHLLADGHKVWVAETAQDGVRQLEDETFDIVLLDSNLPDIDSVALLPTFMDIFPETTVIRMSADSTQESASSAANKGYLPFLTKPLDMDIVLAKVREVFEDENGFSERRRSMRMNEEIQERFRTMIEASNDLFFQCNTDGIITYCSPASTKMLDYSPEEVIGTHFKDYFPVSELPRAMDSFRKVLSGKSGELQELVILRKDKTLLPVAVNAVPSDRAGQVTGPQ